MSKKEFLEMVKQDFMMPDLPDDETTPLRPKTKSLNNARLIPLQQILADPDQPRKTFDESKLRELADSIKSRGIIQPLVVRPHNTEGYVIVTGERRFRAAQIAGLSEVPCIVREVTAEETVILQMIENLHRDDLKPVEEAKGIRRLTETGLTQTDISKLIGKSQPYVSQILKILTLPDKILRESERNRVTKEHLLQLTKSDNPEKMWQEIRRGGAAAQIKKEIGKDKNPKGRPRNYRYRYNPKGKTFRVTVEFRKPHADAEEIKAALNEAATHFAKEANQKPGIAAG